MKTIFRVMELENIPVAALEWLEWDSGKAFTWPELP